MSGKNKSKSMSVTSQTSGPEEWMRTEGKSLYESAASAIPDHYVKYDGERVADFGEDYYTARDMIRNMAGSQPTDLNTARTVLDSIRDSSNNDVNKGPADYINPYTDAVLDPTIRKLREERQLQLNQDNAAATMAGAFGDPQAGIARALTTDRFNTQISDATSKAYSDAWDKGQTQANTVMSRMMQMPQLYMGLDQAGFNRNTALSRYLTGFGQADQALDQARNDVAYQDFKDEHRGGWAGARSGLLMDLLNASPHNTYTNGTSTTTNETKDNSGLQLLGKLGGTILGGLMGGPAGASIGGSLGGGLFGGGSAGGAQQPSFFSPNGTAVNNASTGGQYEWSPGGYF